MNAAEELMSALTLASMRRCASRVSIPASATEEDVQEMRAGLYDQVMYETNLSKSRILGEPRFRVENDYLRARRYAVIEWEEV